MKINGRLPEKSLDDVEGIDPEEVLKEYNLKVVDLDTDGGVTEAANA
jgi:hypothetical protein